MKKWNRWQDWVSVAAGIIAAVSTLWTKQQGMSMTLMLLFGALLVVSGPANLAMPGTPVIEWVQAVPAPPGLSSPGGSGPTPVPPVPPGSHGRQGSWR